MFEVVDQPGLSGIEVSAMLLASGFYQVTRFQQQPVLYLTFCLGLIAD